MDSKDTVFYTKKTLGLKGNILELSRPVVMGILNCTPDSFYEGSRVQHIEAIVERAGQQLRNGATIIDVGGYSSRPGAADISEEEELARVVPCIAAIARAYPEAYISVDTFRARVAEASVEAGACIVNDISGGTLDENMFETVARLGVPYVLMHMRGTPQTMTALNKYDNLVLDILQDLQSKIYRLRQLGQKDIIVDPGFGFAKNIKQNFELLRSLSCFTMLGLPVLVGLSRKSMIYKTLGIPVAEALNGTTVLQTLALSKGVSILRTHDVKEAVEVVKLFSVCNE